MPLKFLMYLVIGLVINYVFILHKYILFYIYTKASYTLGEGGNTNQNAQIRLKVFTESSYLSSADMH